MVEAHAILQLQLAVDDLETVIGDGVGVGVACIGIGRSERADHGTGVVLRNRIVVEGDIRRDFVLIADGDGEGLGA